MTAPPRHPAFLDTRQPFSRADARAAGISRSELLGSRYQKVLYDSYVAASVRVTRQLRAQAALRVSSPDAYLSHFTAAELWGGVVPHTPFVHLSTPGDTHRCRRQGVKAHTSAGRPAPVRHRGLAISTPVQTFFDLAAAGLSLVQLVVLGDSLVKAERTTPEALVEATASYQGRAAKLARRAAGYVRDGVDSPMESRLRMLIVLAGLPEPKVNLIIRRPDGSWWIRFDLCYPEFRLIVEYDGRQHAEDTAQWQHDLARREELDRRGERLLVVTKDDFYDRTEQVLVRVRDALVDRGATGVIRRFRPEWRSYFGSRP